MQGMDSCVALAEGNAQSSLASRRKHHINPFIFSLTQSATPHAPQSPHQSAPLTQSSRPALPQSAGNAGYPQTSKSSPCDPSTTSDTPGSHQHGNSTPPAAPPQSTAPY